MKLGEIYEAIKNDLPSSIEDLKLNNYKVTFIFRDTFGDSVNCEFNGEGEIIFLWDHDHGILLDPKMIQFMWRISRMAKDQPWG